LFINIGNEQQKQNTNLPLRASQNWTMIMLNICITGKGVMGGAESNPPLPPAEPLVCFMLFLNIAIVERRSRDPSVFGLPLLLFFLLRLVNGDGIRSGLSAATSKKMGKKGEEESR
jgi:hypothetical protein